MYERFEETLIAHCAPTLAGHKAGSLFSYRLADGEAPQEYVIRINEALCPKGACARLLKHCEDGCLVYVYRPAALQALLSQAQTAHFLAAYGYGGLEPDEALRHLSRRIRCGEEFPHEIGVFLGYPLGDVIGFIEHKGGNYCCLGFWKAYTDEEDARRRFALYRKCRDIYMACYRRGLSVMRLTVAA